VHGSNDSAKSISKRDEPHLSVARHPSANIRVVPVTPPSERVRNTVAFARLTCPERSPTWRVVVASCVARDVLATDLRSRHRHGWSVRLSLLPFWRLRVSTNRSARASEKKHTPTPSNCTPNAGQLIFYALHDCQRGETKQSVLTFGHAQTCVCVIAQLLWTFRAQHIVKREFSNRSRIILAGSCMLRSTQVQPNRSLS
jgi:hypothetical protein